MKDYMRTAEAAKRLNITTRTMARWIKRGFFPGAFKVNPHVPNSPFLIPVSAVEAFEQYRHDGKQVQS